MWAGYTGARMSDPDIAVSPESETALSVSILGSSATREFVRYFIASGIALAVDVGLLTLLTSIVGVPYLISGAVAFIAGLIIIYVLSIFWVFEKRVVRSVLREFTVFCVIGIVGLGINEAILWFMTGVLGVLYLAGKFASIIIVFAWNFGARKFMLFSRR